MQYSLLIGRILLAAPFILSAPHHFEGDLARLAADHGVPAASFLVPLSGMLALAGGLSVLLGYKGKVGAWTLVLFLVPVTLTMHNFWDVADPTPARIQEVMFMKNLAIIGGALVIASFGTGPLSVDAYMRNHEFEVSKADESAVAHT